MLSRLAIGLVLMALCVIIHAAGVSKALRHLRQHALRGQEFWAITRLFVLVAGWIVLLHVAEIAVWAYFFLWRDVMPSLATALYFSAVTYTTTGYGDLVLPEGWRIVGGVEALTGILMCGWSTGVFLAVATRVYTYIPGTPDS
jgi:hypothetical protein